MQARLTGYRLSDGSEHRLTVPLEASATLEIYPPLAIVPELVVLPWDPQTAPTYNIQLNVSARLAATGGRDRFCVCSVARCYWIGTW